MVITPRISKCFHKTVAGATIELHLVARDIVLSPSNRSISMYRCIDDAERRATASRAFTHAENGESIVDRARCQINEPDERKRRRTFLRSYRHVSQMLNRALNFRRRNPAAGGFFWRKRRKCDHICANGDRQRRVLPLRSHGELSRD